MGLSKNKMHHVSYFYRFMKFTLFTVSDKLSYTVDAPNFSPKNMQKCVKVCISVHRIFQNGSKWLKKLVQSFLSVIKNPLHAFGEK